MTKRIEPTTERRCLKCRKMFASRLSKAVKRICPPCMQFNQKIQRVEAVDDCLHRRGGLKTGG